MREHSRKKAERRSAPNPVPDRKPGARAQRLPRILLGLILAFGAFLRFDQIATIPPALCSDEAMNGNDALENLETGRLAVFYPQNGGREGLFINIQTAFVYLFGNKPWALRLPSAIFGTLTIWGVYCLAAELFSVPAALLASFFLATSFWHIDFSRIGLRAISSVFFLVWALYFLLDGLRRARRGRPYTGRMAWAGAVYGLGFYTYIAYRASPPLVALILVYGYVLARRNGWVAALAKASAAYALTAMAVVVPLALYFVGDPEMLFHRSAEVSIFSMPQALRRAAPEYPQDDPDDLHQGRLRLAA
jgi:4-amino-4-deoxy-L-arabinose transferase-like glycosyltransferase